MERRIIFFVLVVLLLLCLRIWNFYQNKSNYINGDPVQFQTTLLSEPKTSGSQQRFWVVLEDGTKFFVVTSRYPGYHYGDILEISGTIQAVSQDKKSTSNGEVPRNKNTVLTIYSPQIKAGKIAGNFALAVPTFFRQHITNFFQETLPPKASSLLLGITFGIKEQMPQDFYENLKTTGVLHVVAASGMNVTMLGGLLGSLYMLLFRRQVALVLASIGILFYAVLAGLEPSIVRAALMGVLVFAAQVIGRQYVGSYGLFLAASLMLFFDPTLLFDIGFQLSFVATIGLLYIRPILSVFPKKFLLTEDIHTTIAAQIATLPILLSNFGTYSLLSILVNALVLWTVPILMLFGGIGAVVGMVFAPLGKLFLYFSLPFLLYFTEIVSVFSKAGTVLTVEVFPWQWAVSYYLLLIAIVLGFFRKKAVKE